MTVCCAGPGPRGCNAVPVVMQPTCGQGNKAGDSAIWYASWAAVVPARAASARQQAASMEGAKRFAAMLYRVGLRVRWVPSWKGYRWVRTRQNAVEL